MRDIDDTDRQILRLLLEDSRRPYNEIADHVDLSPPAVSDRVDRLRDLGVVRRFTVDLDQSTLRDGVEVFVSLVLAPDTVPEAKAALRNRQGVEHVYETVDGRLFLSATVPHGDVSGFVADAVDPEAVREVDVRLLADATWNPNLGDATLGLPCAECDNTVTGEGVVATLGGDRYEFCCTSCRSQFRDRYDSLQEGS